MRSFLLEIRPVFEDLILIFNYETFKLNKDFRRIYGQGKNFIYPALVVYIKKNRLNRHRIGVTVSKKIGCAVKRNRAKRVILAAFRECRPMLRGGYDIVFVGRARTTRCNMWEVADAMRASFSKMEKTAVNEGCSAGADTDEKAAR